jgi:integrase
VQQGRNPAAEKQKAKATAARDWTVRDLAKATLAKKLVSLANSTQVSYGRHLKRVEKKLGALTVREIEASDVVALIEGAGLTWGESNMLLITAKCLFTHACGKRLINANPCHGIMLSALLGERPPRRQRLMLTREELKLLLAAPMRRRNALAVRILLATAVRSAELYQAKWADVDLDGAQWHIPKSKTGAAMDIPLAPVVVDWFRELRTLAGNSAYVLPAHSRSRAARHGGDTHLNKDTLREAIAHWLRTARPAVRRFTPHDLRSTVKSHLRALGVPRDISEMCLNHRLSRVEGIYDRHTYFEERREALGKWAGAAGHRGHIIRSAQLIGRRSMCGGYPGNAIRRRKPRLASAPTNPSRLGAVNHVQCASGRCCCKQSPTDGHWPKASHRPESNR